MWGKENWWSYGRRRKACPAWKKITLVLMFDSKAAVAKSCRHNGPPTVDAVSYITVLEADHVTAACRSLVRMERQKQCVGSNKKLDARLSLRDSCYATAASSGMRPVTGRQNCPQSVSQVLGSYYGRLGCDYFLEGITRRKKIFHCPHKFHSWHSLGEADAVFWDCNLGIKACMRRCWFYSIVGFILL